VIASQRSTIWILLMVAEQASCLSQGWNVFAENFLPLQPHHYRHVFEAATLEQQVWCSHSKQHGINLSSCNAY
jgi:hypothetical protein